jgi:hypothetical protein
VGGFEVRSGSRGGFDVGGQLVSRGASTRGLGIAVGHSRASLVEGDLRRSELRLSRRERRFDGAESVEALDLGHEAISGFFEIGEGKGAQLGLIGFDSYSGRTGALFGLCSLFERPRGPQHGSGFAPALEARSLLVDRCSSRHDGRLASEEPRAPSQRLDQSCGGAASRFGRIADRPRPVATRGGTGRGI